MHHRKDVLCIHNFDFVNVVTFSHVRYTKTLISEKIHLYEMLITNLLFCCNRVEKFQIDEIKTDNNIFVMTKTTFSWWQITRVRVRTQQLRVSNREFEFHIVDLSMNKSTTNIYRNTITIYDQSLFTDNFWYRYCYIRQTFVSIRHFSSRFFFLYTTYRVFLATLVSARQMQKMKTSILRVQKCTMNQIFVRNTRDVHDIREKKNYKHWIECRERNSIEKSTENDDA